MNASAIKAVEDRAAKFLNKLKGRTTTNWAAMRYLMGIKVLHLVTPRTKACRFSATKIV